MSPGFSAPVSRVRSEGPAPGRLDPDEPSEVCVGGRRRGMENPGMEELLAVLDETEELVRAGGELGGC